MSFRFEKKYLLLMCITGFLVSIDQITKLYVHTQFLLHESMPVIRDLFHITYVRNYGAAFGMLAQTPASFREFFFLMIPPIACITILYILKSVRDDDTKQILALSCIFGGALGNYLDRLQFRYVIDFLDFHYGTWSWPSFNISDMAIVCGVISLVWIMFKETEPATK